MMQLLSWLCKRVVCSLKGHKLTPGRFYHGPSCSVQSGYVCQRCGNTQLLAYCWQEIHAGENND